MLGLQPYATMLGKNCVNAMLTGDEWTQGSLGHLGLSHKDRRALPQQLTDHMED